MAEKPQKSKKPSWVIDKERARRAAAAETVWLFGLHAVRDALSNPQREKLRLVVTQNALDRLGPLPDSITPEITDARSFDKVVPLPPESVHQGAALEVKPLKWGSVADLALSGPGKPLLVALDPGWVQTEMGGAAAPLSVAQSVQGLMQALAQVKPEDRGQLLRHDGRYIRLSDA